VAAGPGLGTSEAAAFVLHVVASAEALPTVLDADALNIAAGPGLGTSEAAAAGALDLAAVGRTRPLLITPHAGEMARLQPDGTNLAEDRVAAARAASTRFQCTVLLKGAPSVVAAPGQPVSVDTQTSSDLAVAGMGDVLSGVCAGLMAQGLGPVTAGPVGLYLAGRAARLAGRGAALTPSDVLRWLPEALSEPGGGDSDLAMPFITFDADPAD
jgi:NAD(P)H-hydrate epimerase